MGRHPRIDDLFEVLLVGLRQVSLGGQRLDDARVEATCKQGQQLGSHSISRNGHVVVRSIVEKGDATLREKRSNVVSRTVDQRPDHNATARMHPCETASACPTHQTQEKRFRLIVLRVTDSDDIGLVGSDRTFEEGVSNVVSRIFERTMFLTRNCANVRALCDELESEFSRGVGAELFVGVCFIAKLVIQVRDRNELQFAGIAQRSQHVE